MATRVNTRATNCWGRLYLSGYIWCRAAWSEAEAGRCPSFIVWISVSRPGRSRCAIAPGSWLVWGAGRPHRGLPYRCGFPRRGADVGIRAQGFGRAGGHAADAAPSPRPGLARSAAACREIHLRNCITSWSGGRRFSSLVADDMAAFGGPGGVQPCTGSGWRVAGLGAVLPEGDQRRAISRLRKKSHIGARSRV